MNDNPIDFWKEINLGYDFIKVKKFDNIFNLILKLQAIKWPIDEKLAIDTLEAWMLFFTMKFKELIPITKGLITCEEGTMPAWYRGLGYFLKGLSWLYSCDNRRFSSFSMAAENYKIHITQEIPQFSSPPNSEINTFVSTFFQGICVLEASGSFEILENLLNKLSKEADQPKDLFRRELIKVIKLQIKVRKGNISPKIINTVLRQLDESDDPLYYCNIILRARCCKEIFDPL